MSFVKKLITLKICFLLPARLSFWALNILGHKVASTSKIGFSLIWIDKLVLNDRARIGNFNFIKISSLEIGKDGYVGKFNKISGPIEIILAETAAIGNGNKIDRAPLGVTYGTAILRLGILSKLTGNHRLDCTRSIVIGDYTTLAGHDSQIWTHSYYHDKSGPGRFRVDGAVEIGNNVYIGSRSIITGGVKIVDSVVVGANSSVSKSLLVAGTYINQPLRHIESAEVDNLRDKFIKVEGYDVCEEIYERRS